MIKLDKEKMMERKLNPSYEIRNIPICNHQGFYNLQDNKDFLRYLGL